MTKTNHNYRKTGWLSFLCGIWNLVLGLLFGFAFIFSCFDIGDGYEKVGLIYKELAYNISWLGMLLFGINIISSFLLLIAGGLLIFGRKNEKMLILGLYGIYLYFACFGIITLLLISSGGTAGAGLIWIAIALTVLIPSFCLQKIRSQIMNYE